MTEIDQIVLRFKNERLTKATPPSWFRRATSTNGNLEEELRKVGARVLDEIGENGERIEIFRTPEGGYLVVQRYNGSRVQRFSRYPC